MMDNTGFVFPTIKKQKELVVALGLAALFLAGCGTREVVVVTATPDPVDEAAEYLDWAFNIGQRWDDAVAIADSTARMSLSGPLANLQGLRREAQAFEINDQAITNVHNRLTWAMDHAIDGFLKFMADSDSNYIQDFGLYQTELEKWTNGLANLEN